MKYKIILSSIFLGLILLVFVISNIKITNNFYGTSMNPTIKEGDILVLWKLNNQSEFKEGEIYAYALDWSDYQVHRYIGINNINCEVDWCKNKTFYMFKGDNEVYRDTVLIEAEDIKYKLIHVIKNGKGI